MNKKHSWNNLRWKPATCTVSGKHQTGFIWNNWPNIFNKYMWLVCIYQVYCLYLSTKPICRFLFQKENPLWWKMHTVGFAVTLWNQKKNKQNSYISYMLPDKTWNHWRVMSGRNQQRTILCTERLSYFMVWNTGSLQTVVSKYHRGPFSAVLFFSSVSRPDIFLLFS